jgi:hypothetical protein
MKARWSSLRRLRACASAHIESRVRKLGQEHHDLIALRLAGATDRHAHGARQVRIACLVREQSSAVCASHEALGRALNHELDDLEHAIHRLRDRRGAQRRRARVKLPLQPAAALGLNA